MLSIDVQEYLAQRDLVHGDLSARKIYVSSDYKLKISDFGISTDIYEWLHHHTGSGPLLIRWMALESILDRQFTTMSDV